jgi:hypothetical protein
MRCRLFLILVFLMLSFFAASLLSARNADAASFTQEHRPENLKALWELILQSHYVKHDSKTAAALLGGLVPDQSRIRKALKDGTAPAIAQRIAAKFHEFGLPTAANLAQFLPGVMGPVTVYGATTEELAAYQEGSTAFKHFPGGAQKAAQQILRPGMKFYQVVISSPGGKASVTYSMLYWDGHQWTMLAKPWQVLR